MRTGTQKIDRFLETLVLIMDIQKIPGKFFVIVLHNDADQLNQCLRNLCPYTVRF